MCSNPALSNKKEYPTFARTYSDWTPSLIKVLERFDWNIVALIYTEKKEKFEAARKNLIKKFENSSRRIKVSCKQPVEDSFKVFRELSEDTSWASKIYRPFMSQLKGGSKY